MPQPEKDSSGRPDNTQVDFGTQTRIKCLVDEIGEFLKHYGSRPKGLDELSIAKFKIDRPKFWSTFSFQDADDRNITIGKYSDGKIQFWTICETRRDEREYHYPQPVFKYERYIFFQKDDLFKLYMNLNISPGLPDPDNFQTNYYGYLPDKEREHIIDYFDVYLTKARLEAERQKTQNIIYQTGKLVNKLFTGSAANRE